ncbi:hypothetical protein MNBD_GAMMA13-1045 [hydrothermal vent metagenome]|uniref:Uncharacterized protein n=1 Tax=hydrothermal vent metagenome TaxID=652676 RepID=A0A3B0YU58_9ZZZZ
MSNQPSDAGIRDAIQTIDQDESLKEIREALKTAQKHLKSMPDGSNPVERGRALLNVAEPLLGLAQDVKAWQYAREAFSVFIDYEHWQDAVEATDILYQCGHADSIVALGQGIWLGVTYPVRAQSTVTLLDHVIDETPDDSDGAAVAAMAAHYIAGLRTRGEEKTSLTFLTTQLIARVAKRHRGIEDQATLDTWIEMYKLNDIPELLKRLGVIVDIMVGDNWWFDRDELRSKLPVN